MMCFGRALLLLYFQDLKRTKQSYISIQCQIFYIILINILTPTMECHFLPSVGRGYHYGGRIQQQRLL